MLPVELVFDECDDILDDLGWPEVIMILVDFIELLVALVVGHDVESVLDVDHRVRITSHE